MTDKLFTVLASFLHSSMAAACILFALGLLLLIKGGDWFVDSASGIAHKFHVPELLIGATVVSIGTTLPEVMVSATAAVQGSGGIAYGNAIGSVICNTALIAALTIAIRPAPVDKKTLRAPVAFFFGAAAVYLISAYAFGRFNRITGVIFLLIFAVYMAVNITTAVKMPKIPEENEENGDGKSTFIMVIFLIIGAALIAVGSDLLVDNGMIIAEELGVPESVIALTFVALGTSLPELVTAVTSLIKGHGALSLGNIIGANFLNLVFVSGIAPLLSPFDIPAGKTLLGVNASLIIDLPVMLAVMGILTLPPLLKGKLTRVQGVILLIIYAAFCTLQFVL